MKGILMLFSTRLMLLPLLLVPTLYVLVEGRKDRKNRAHEKPVEKQETSKQEVVQGA